MSNTRQPMPLELRLLKNIKVSGDGCWEWQLRRVKGYGRIFIGNRPRLAHRVSYETFWGAIPEGMLVCHKCDNRRCIYPLHLFLGTPMDNTHDMMRKGRSRFGSPAGAFLSTDDVLDIRKRVAAGETQKSVARLYGIAQTTVGCIARGTVYAGLGGPVARQRPHYTRIQNGVAQEVWAMRSQGLSQTQIAEKVGFSQTAIGKLLRRMHSKQEV